LIEVLSSDELCAAGVGKAAPRQRLPGTLCPLINQTPGFCNSRMTFNKLTWKGGIEVDLAERSLLFAYVSRGFKAEGFNQAVSMTNPTKLQPFAPEAITAKKLESRTTS
jgi:iron complex outermembrane recepter protein